MILNGWHWLFILISLLVILGTIMYTRHQAKSLEGFSLNGRSASRYMVAGALVSTLIGGAITIGSVQTANMAGISGGWMILGCGLGALLLGLIYAGPLRSSGCTTLGGYIRLKYGDRAGTAASIVSTVGMYFSLVASGLSGLHFIQILTGVPLVEALGILIVAVLLYTLIGGMKGTSLSGIVKTAFLYLTLAVAGCIAFFNLQAYFPSWYASDFFIGSLISSPFQLGDKILSAIIGVGVTQSYAQAVFSGRTIQEAKWGCFLTALVLIPLGIPLVLIGSYIHLAHPEVLNILALPYFLGTYLPAWLGGLALGAIFISIVGSIAGISLGAATNITMDIGSTILGIENKKALLVILRSTIVVLTITAIGISLMNYNSEVLLWNFLSFTLRAVGVFLLLLLAVLGYASMKEKRAVATILISTLIATIHAFYPLPYVKILTPLDLGILISFLFIILDRLFVKL